VLARHKRLVHTKPEDREPPKKRGRPPKSSYITEGSQPLVPPKNSSTTHIPVTSNNTTSSDIRWPDINQDASERSAQTAFHFPKLDSESQNGTFLSNPFNDNFGVGPLDTLSEFNFAEQDILSFLNPARTIRESTVYAADTTTPGAKPVVLQPDFVDWLQMNRDDYSFSMQHSSPQGLEGAAAAPNLIEPNESKEVLVNPANPNTSISIDEKSYGELQASLQTKYKVSSLPPNHSECRKMLPLISCYQVEGLWNDSSLCFSTVFIHISPSCMFRRSIRATLRVLASPCLFNVSSPSPFIYLLYRRNVLHGTGQSSGVMGSIATNCGRHGLSLPTLEIPDIRLRRIVLLRASIQVGLVKFYFSIVGTRLGLEIINFWNGLLGGAAPLLLSRLLGFFLTLVCHSETDCLITEWSDIYRFYMAKLDCK